MRALLGLPCKILLRVLQLVTGIHIDPPTQIGPGLFIGHHGGIWISPAAVLGSNCNIAQGVTIGRAGRIPRPAPVLGDRVWVGPNATISGPVRVGNGAVVAANSLVVASVPDNGVVIGVPARVMSYSGSWELDRRARLRLIAGSPGCERADSDRRFRVPGAVQSGGRSATAGCGKRPGGRPGGEPLASEVVTD